MINGYKPERRSMSASRGNIVVYTATSPTIEKASTSTKKGGKESPECPAYTPVSHNETHVS